MTGLAMPDESRLPHGPARNLTAALYALYEAAGKPGTRKISKEIRERDDLPDTVSHEAVRAILGGSRSGWHKVESLVRLLADWSVDRPDVAKTVAKIQELWLACDKMEPGVRPADPAVLRQAVRGLHGPTDRDALAALLRSLMFVPQAENGGFLVALLPDGERWLCVFTNLERLRAHQRLTPPGWAGGWVELLGSELVRQVRRLDPPVGLLVDPATAPGTDVTETLPIPATLLAELGDGR
jgi:hypothetical protein